MRGRPRASLRETVWSGVECSEKSGALVPGGSGPRGASVTGSFVFMVGRLTNVEQLKNLGRSEVSARDRPPHADRASARPHRPPSGRYAYTPPPALSSPSNALGRPRPTYRASPATDRDAPMAGSFSGLVHNFLPSFT